MTIGKPQIIEAIRQLNPTAKRPWLEKFTVGDLGRYLDHLQLTLEPRGSRSPGGQRRRQPGNNRLSSARILR